MAYKGLMSECCDAKPLEVKTEGGTIPQCSKCEKKMCKLIPADPDTRRGPLPEDMPSEKSEEN